MPQSLEVSPEHLFNARARLSGEQSTASGSIGSASLFIAPVSAAADPVSLAAAASFASKAQVLMSALTDGLAKFQAGADLLSPIASQYQNTDTDGGSGIAANQADVV